MKRFITFIAVMLLATLVHAFGEYTIPVPASYDVLASEHTLVDLVQVDGNTVLRFTNAGGTWVGTSENGEQFHMSYAPAPDPFWYVHVEGGTDGTLTLTEHFHEDSFLGATAYNWERTFTIEGELFNAPIFADLTRVADQRTNVIAHDWFYSSSSYPQLNIATPGAARMNARIDTLYGVLPMMADYEEYFAEAEPMRSPFETERSTILIGAAGPFVQLFSVTNVNMGGAHPNAYGETTLLYLADDGVETFDITQLFYADTNWLAELGQFVQAALIEQGASWPGEEGAEEPFTAEELGKFMLTPEGFVVYFDAYEVGPYASGSYSVVVPYDLVLPFAFKEGAVELFAHGTPPSLF